MPTYSELPPRADSMADLCAILGAITFAPLQLHGWTVAPVRLGAAGTIYGWTIAPSHTRADRDTGEICLGHGRPFLVSMCDTRAQVGRTAWLALKTLLDHEALECFKIAGERVFDPHAPGVAGG